MHRQELIKSSSKKNLAKQLKEVGRIYLALVKLLQRIRARWDMSYPNSIVPRCCKGYVAPSSA